MSNEQTITITGRLAGDPELRFTPSGAAVVNFTVAYTPRKFDRQTNEWKDGVTQWWRCAAWNAGKLPMAENIAGLLKKGDNVLVVGALEAREYEKDGQTRTVTEVRVEHVGKDCRFHGEPSNSAYDPIAGRQDQDPWAANQPTDAPF